MSDISVLQQQLANLTQRFNLWEQNAKTTSELPEMVTLNQAAILRAVIGGVSQRLVISKIVEAAQSGSNGLSAWEPKTYSQITGVIRNDRIYLLSSATSLPFESVNFDLELALGKWILPYIPSTVEIVESPNTVVFDLGDISDLLTDHNFVAYINENGDTYNMTNNDKTYYFRFIDHGMDYLYVYDSDAGGYVEYGDGTGNTMMLPYLHLFFNSTVNPGGGGSQNLESVLGFGGRPIVIVDGMSELTIIPEHKGQHIIVTGNFGLTLNFLDEGNFEVGDEIVITKRTDDIGSCLFIYDFIGVGDAEDYFDLSLYPIGATVIYTKVDDSDPAKWNVRFEYGAIPDAGASESFVTSAIASAITAIKDGVPGSFDTLNELYQLALNSREVYSVTNPAAAESLTANSASFIYVNDDTGTGEWGIYWVFSDGVGDNVRLFGLSDFGGGGGAVSSVNGETGAVTLNQDDIADGTTYKQYSATDKAKVGHITVTQAVDLDAIETRVNGLDAAVVLKGVWDASTGSFPGSGTAQAGESWIVSVAGTVNGVSFAVNDRVIAITDNASTSTFASNWFKADYTDQVLSVAGKTGPVTLVAADITDFNTAAASAAPAETAITLGTLINAATTKSAPVDADYLGLMDSAASNILKKLSWANIKATLKTYFDTLYVSSGYVKVVAKSTTNSSAVTGTTSETILESILVPANEFAAGFILRAKSAFNKTGSAGNVTIRYRVHTLNQISGATLIGTFSNTSSLTVPIERDVFFKASNIIDFFPPTTSAVYENQGSTLARGSATLDPTASFYFIITAQLSNAADSIVNSNYTIDKV